ncbi:MAG: hypothetical protein D6812_15260 [Deltaproteobacteria bacterium]|nr:MAG: hypothetical protein D6812_15260 [Deltaproteobacteria bacterium]
MPQGKGHEAVRGRGGICLLLLLLYPLGSAHASWRLFLSATGNYYDQATLVSPSAAARSSAEGESQETPADLSLAVTPALSFEDRFGRFEVAASGSVGMEVFAVETTRNRVGNPLHLAGKLTWFAAERTRLAAGYQQRITANAFQREERELFTPAADAVSHELDFDLSHRFTESLHLSLTERYALAFYGSGLEDSEESTTQILFSTPLSGRTFLSAGGAASLLRFENLSGTRSFDLNASIHHRYAERFEGSGGGGLLLVEQGSGTPRTALSFDFQLAWHASRGKIGGFFSRNVSSTGGLAGSALTSSGGLDLGVRFTENVSSDLRLRAVRSEFLDPERAARALAIDAQLGIGAKISREWQLSIAYTRVLQRISPVTDLVPATALESDRIAITLGRQWDLDAERPWRL